MSRKGFTVIELLVVIAIIAILAALIFPVLAKARNSAKQSTCLSNLKQIGGAFSIYMQDYDDRWPLGLDPADKYTPQIWSGFPEFQARIPELPLMHELLQTYLPSRRVWECPADRGQIIDDISFELMQTFHSFRQYGSSYYYRTELTVHQLTGTSLTDITAINVYFDGSGAWHTGQDLIRQDDTFEQMQRKLTRYRYNVLFGDMHAKNLTRAQYMEAWDTPVAP
ncbi:MAG: prepilin-type N-terminal cleavage/methylation domain-containing protein [Fimbriimonadales bacterium]|nr:prepilin-type N-terminal cleavage/methylation domain-containing protein [Fimbriimonadales bacterium]